MFNKSTINASEVAMMLEDLTIATSPQGVSQFPRDLQSTNNVVSMTLRFLMDNLLADFETPISFNSVSVKSTNYSQ